MKKAILSLFLFLVIISNANAAQQQELTQECRNFLAGLPQKYKRGWLKVPENWGNPNGRKIDIFFYTRITTEQTPIVYINGGPLGTDHRSYKDFETQESRQGIGFVYFDQRGTGCSTQVPISQNIETFARSAFYSTDQVSFDLEYLRRTLFGENKKWKLFGQSFGGTIATRYVELFPETVIGVYTYSGGFIKDFKQFFATRIYIQNVITKKVLGPAGFKRLDHVRQSFTPSTCLTSSSGNKACGPALAQLYFEEGMSFKEDWAQFSDELANKILLPNGAIDLSVVQSRVGFGFEFFFTPSFIASRSLWRQELKTVTGLGPGTADCQAAESYLKSKGIDPDKLTLNHCRIIRFADTSMDENFVNQVVGFYPIRKIQDPESVIRVIEKYKIPTYYFTGDLDIYDIAGGFVKNASSQTTHLKYIEFVNEDHFGYFRQKYFWDVLNR